MTNTEQHIFRHSRQRGASLIISLLILALVAMLVVTGMTVSNTETKQAGNVQSQNAAFNQVETAIATAQNWLQAGTNFRAPGFTTYSAGTPHLYPAGYLTSHGLDPLVMTWSDANSLAVDAAGTQRYFVEKFAASKVLPGSNLSVGNRSSSVCSRVDLFRVTGRGTGARGTLKFVQTYTAVLSC